MVHLFWYFIITGFISSMDMTNVTNIKYTYPPLYRDHIFGNLTEKGRNIFFAMNIHPICAKKGGECIIRAKCIEKKMLYISRVCYKRELVCCYDDTPKRILVASESYPQITQKSVLRMGTEITFSTLDEISDLTTQMSVSDSEDAIIKTSPPL